MDVVRKYYLYDNFFESTSRFEKKRSKIIGLKLLFDASCDVLCAENVLFLVFKKIEMLFLDFSLQFDVLDDFKGYTPKRYSIQMSNNSILKITPKFILSLVDKVQVLKYKKSSRNSVTNRIKKSTENNNYYHCHTVIFSSLLHVVLAGQPAEARGQRPTSTCGIITHGIKTNVCRSLKSFIHFHNKQLKTQTKRRIQPGTYRCHLGGS